MELVMDNLGLGCACNDITEIAPQNNEELYPASLEQSKGISSETNDMYAILKFPGWGKLEYGSLCGKVIAIETCENHPEESKFIVNRCFDPQCPFCYESWIGREIRTSKNILLEAKQLYSEKGLNLGEIKHIIVSPPQAPAIEQIETIGGIRTLRADCREFLTKIGALGGLIVFHAYKVKEPFKKTFGIYKKDGGKGGLWDWIMANDLLNEAVYLAPHFHSLLYGFLKDSDLVVDDFYNNKRTNRFNGWIYKNKEPDVDGFRDIAATISYQLNHCTLVYKNIYEKRPVHALTWFGLLSYNKIGIIKETKKPIPVYPVCKTCGEPIHKFVDKINDDIFVPEWLRDNPEYLFSFCYLHDLGEVKHEIIFAEYEIKRNSWYYRWKKKKRKVRKDGKVINNGMIKCHFQFADST